MTAKTFGAWLLDQEQVNYGSAISVIAGVWRETKGDTKIRSLPGVQSALEAAGKLADPTLRGYWDEAVLAWRTLPGNMGQSTDRAMLSEVPKQQEGQQLEFPQPGIGITGDSSADLVRIYEEVTGEPWVDPPSQLDRMEAKLDWLHDVLVKPTGTPFPPWPAYPRPAPIGWQEQFDAADHDTQQEAQ